MSGTLVVRLDSMGDVLISGPAVRAVAASSARTTLLVGSAGREAASLLPGVDDVLVWECPWIQAPAPPVSRPDLDTLVDRIAARSFEEALILTSFHQSALPTALLLRSAGVRRIAAISDDYPGALLDVRLAQPPDEPEPLRMLAVAEGAGFRLPADDDRRLALRRPLPPVDLSSGEYVVVHPGASAAARTYPARHWTRVVKLLAAAGLDVLVTGGKDETALTAEVSGVDGIDCGGSFDLAQLAVVLQGARAVAVANTGPAHLAAAVATPVVVLFAPVVPSVRWAPYGVPSRVLGDQHAECRGSRARECSWPGHPCLGGVDPVDVARAVLELSGGRRP